jgi:hypothetical protein
MKFFGTTYVVRKDEKLLYRGKNASHAERIASGNAQNGSASVYAKHGGKEVLQKEYTRADWDRTHRQTDSPPPPADGTN